MWQVKHDVIQSPGDAEPMIVEDFGASAGWSRSDVKDRATRSDQPDGIDETECAEHGFLPGYTIISLKTISTAPSGQTSTHTPQP